MKRLRDVAVGGREEKCDSCPYAEDYPRCVDCLEKLHKQAADAIEELSKPRWIPVTERLPEEYVDVLCYCSRNGQYGCGEWSKEDNGTIYWTGLYGMIPTHWMPLPEPPKEK